MHVLLVDNYDSFTYNLYHYLVMCDVDVSVRRNDEISLAEVDLYDKIILSPGPGLPQQTAMMYAILGHYSKPILGVCLGMQGIGTFFGAQLINQQKVKHGVQTSIQIDNTSKLYREIPTTFCVGLYHSWCVDPTSVPPCLRITAYSEQQVIMSLEHVNRPIFGVQYHPESILSEHGLTILKNFLYLC